jgi:hypothetical protein
MALSGLLKAAFIAVYPYSLVNPISTTSFRKFSNSCPTRNADDPT